MSKPPSGLFRGTMGALKSGDYPEDLIAKRIAESATLLDLREHPLQQSQLSTKQRKALQQKIDKRTITAAEWKQMEWDRRLNKRRRKGIQSFWKNERKLLLSGKPGTRNWSAEQISDILNKKTPRFKGKSLQSHHSFSVSKYPHLANRPEVIYPVTNKEHLYYWHGGNFRKSLPGKPVKSKREF